MARYEFSEGSSNKFWEIELRGRSLVTRYGKIGSDGQSTEKAWPSEKEAKIQHDTLVAEKTRKGYVLVEPSAAARATAPRKTAPPTKAIVPPKERAPIAVKIDTYAQRVAFTGDGRTIFAIGNNRLHRYEIAPGKLDTFTSDVGWGDLAISPTEPIVACSDEARIVLFGTDGKKRGTLTARKKPEGIAAIAFSANGKLIAAATGHMNSERTSIEIWSTAGDHVRAIEHNALEFGRKAITFTPDGKQLLTFNEGALETWAVASGKLLDQQRVKGAGEADAERLSCASNGRVLVQLVQALQDFTVLTVGLDGKGATKLDGRYESSCFGADGATVVAGVGNRIDVYERGVRKPTRTIERRRKTQVRDVKMSCDGTIAVGTDGAIELYYADSPAKPAAVRDDLVTKGNGAKWSIVGPSKRAATLSYVEKSRLKEEGFRHDRVVAELHVSWGGKARKLLDVYCHDNYRSDKLVLEDGYIDEKVLAEFVAALGTKLEPRDVLRRIGESSPYPEGLALVFETMP